MAVRATRLLPVRGGSLRELVREAIRSAIFSGKLLPGEPIRELDLARDLRVGQSTVREALLQLEHTGLVVRIPNKETTVTNLSRRELQEKLFIRNLLEGPAAALAAALMGEAEFRELEKRRDTLDRALARNAYYEVSQADLDFHRYIWKQSGNATLVPVLENLAAPLFAFIAVYRNTTRPSLAHTMHLHDPIVLAMRGRKPRAIHEAMRRHFEGSYNEFLDSSWEDFRSLLASRGVTPAAAEVSRDRAGQAVSSRGA